MGGCLYYLLVGVVAARQVELGVCDVKNGTPVEGINVEQHLTSIPLFTSPCPPVLNTTVTINSSFSIQYHPNTLCSIPMPKVSAPEQRLCMLPHHHLIERVTLALI
jgi:hypothetical protein